MRIKLNGQDLTPIAGEAMEFRGEVFVSLSFLEGFQAQGITVSKTPDSFNIDVKPEALLRLLSPKTSFPANLELKLGKEQNGQLSAKAELSLGDSGKASIDQNGKIEAGFTFKLYPKTSPPLEPNPIKMLHFP